LFAICANSSTLERLSEMLRAAFVEALKLIVTSLQKSGVARSRPQCGSRTTTIIGDFGVEDRSVGEVEILKTYRLGPAGQIGAL
jgi:hypothetical protein